MPSAERVQGQVVAKVLELEGSSKPLVHGGDLSVDVSGLAGDGGATGLPASTGVSVHGRIHHESGHSRRLSASGGSLVPHMGGVPDV